MNPARKISRVTETNPGLVLQAIGSRSTKQGSDLDGAAFERLAAAPNPEQDTVGELVSENELTAKIEVGAALEHDPNPDLISLRINPETSSNHELPAEDLLAGTAESATQVQQLAARLKDSAIDLGRRESQLEERIKATNQQNARQQSELEIRIHQMEQQASQVRRQQLNLMQLQSDIVKSNDATRAAIESLVLGTGSSDSTIATLKALKHELSGRFDYIARRWEQLAELMQSVNTQIVASQSIDDSVDWIGELS